MQADRNNNSNLDMHRYMKNRKNILRHISKDQQGVSMIEFGLLLPILLLILVGTIEITRLVLFHQKIDNSTARVADLIARTEADPVPCGAGVGGLLWMKQKTLAESLKPFTMNAQTTLIVSSVRAEYQNPLNPNDSILLRHRIEWQWKDGPAISKYGTIGSNAATDTDWPAAFRRSPNNNGLFNGDRVIAVEVNYIYEPLLGISAILLPMLKTHTVHKAAFYRSRFGRMGTLGC